MVKIKRKSRFENRYHPNMGRISVHVTRVYKTILGFKIKTLHEYRETYHGEIKNCRDCSLAKA